MAKSNQSPVTTLHVRVTSYTNDTRVANSDEWDRDNTSTWHSPEGLFLGQGFHQVSVPGVVKPGDSIWVVWAVWDTGDSFGRDDGAGIEFFSAHRAQDLAQANGRALETATNYTVNLTMDDGAVMQVSVPWLGYFEQLQTVHVDRFIVSS